MSQKRRHRWEKGNTEQQRLELSEGHPGKGFDFHSAKLLIHRFAFLTFFFPSVYFSIANTDPDQHPFLIKC